jgi:O-acetyl-ADP-ribose deacetylase (regulator of RNase III)
MPKNEQGDCAAELPIAMVSFYDCSQNEAEGRAFDQFRAEQRAQRRPLARLLNNRIAVYVGDLTEQPVDVIVNAANPELLGGGGVDGAIHQRGGPAVTAACAQLRATSLPAGLATGEAVMTTGGNLPAAFIIHTVGPVYGQHHGQEAALLAACYRNSLLLAQSHQLMRIAFPAISTGRYGYPPAEAAKVAFATLQEMLTDANNFHHVRLVFLVRDDAETFLDAIGYPLSNQQ